MALFLLAEAALASLPTAHFVPLRPSFLFWQVQFVQVFPLKPAPFCKLSAGLGSTNKSSISLLLSLSLPLCLFFFLKLFGTSDRNCLLSPPVPSDYNGYLDTRFSRGTTRLMNCPRHGALLLSYAIPCSLAPLISRIKSSFLGLKEYHLI